MRFATGDGDPAKRRPSAILALSYNTFTIPMDPKGDDDNLEDLCMGTKRTYDEKLEEGKFELVGVNCGGDSFVEGDVLFTMYPKYELAY